MSPIRTILVPHDFSEHSAEALEAAVGLARTLGARIHLVHALRRVREVLSPYGVELPEAVTSEAREAAARALAAERDRIPDAALAGEALVREGPPAETIADAAEALSADLIVMGTHGRSGLGHALLGSVTERTLRLAPCPVLAVKPKADAGGDDREETCSDAS